jgi:hypothetical protein
MGDPAPKQPTEEDLTSQVRKLFSKLPSVSDESYRRLLFHGVVTDRKPKLPTDKFYRGVGSRLRERVERFVMENQGKDPFDRLRQRPPLEDEKMRAAFTLREFKEHEQKPLLDAYMASLPKRQGMSETEARRHLKGVALGLQGGKRRKHHTTTHAATGAGSHSSTTGPSVAEQTEAARLDAEMERQRQEAMEREKERKKRIKEKEEARRREHEEMLERQHARKTETPKERVRGYVQPLFQMLWDMEFDNLHGSNPFRMVIDRNNCAIIGAPNYFDIIERPMNLTWIQEKVEQAKYNNVKEFFDDVDLMIKNALLYNTVTDHPIRLAALRMQAKHKAAAKKLVATLKQKHRDQQSR